MTTTYHTPIATGAAANASTFNTPFSQLDSRLVQIDNAVDTDGTLKAGAVGATAVLADNVVTNAKIADTTIAGGKLANGTITATQIADTTITGGKLVNATITGTQIANTTIENGKIANTTITDAKLAYPVRVAWATIRIGSALSSVSAHSVADTEWDLGIATGNMAIVNRVDAQNSPGIVWDVWVLGDKHVVLRATNVTAGTVNINAATDVLVAVVDLAGGLTETTESIVT